LNQNLNKLLKMAMLCAISIIFVALVRIPIFPQAPWLVYDPADVPLLIGAFLYGPLAGILMTIVTAGIQALFFSADGIVGFMMHVIASGALITVSGLVYRAKRTKKGAVIGLIFGALARAAIMIPANLVISTNFYGMQYDAVVALLPITSAFNLIYASINGLVVFLIYKPLAVLLRREHKISEEKIL
jgi:riboflavin transporter FmnP